MPLLVMKFGGTSVADLERIRRVGRLVAAEVAAGHKVAVVVSAMAGKTNELVAWTDGAGAAAQGLPPSDDEYDVVVASGEQVTAGLLAMTLRNMGLPARSWMGWQIPIIAEDAHGKSRIDDIQPDKLAVSVPINDVTGVSGFVRPGDAVDVLLTRQIPGDNASGSDRMTDVVMQAVRVLAIDQVADPSKTEAAVAKTAAIKNIQKALTARILKRLDDGQPLVEVARKMKAIEGMQP